MNNQVFARFVELNTNLNDIMYFYFSLNENESAINLLIEKIDKLETEAEEEIENFWFEDDVMDYEAEILDRLGGSYTLVNDEEEIKYHKIIEGRLSTQCINDINDINTLESVLKDGGICNLFHLKPNLMII